MEAGERCFPAWTRRRSDSGNDVRTERRVVRFFIDRSSGTVMAMAEDLVSSGSKVDVVLEGCLLSPDTFFTNICILLSRSSGEADRDIGVTDLIVATRSEEIIRRTIWK